MKQVSVVPDAYFDSVFLMSVASQLRELAGVQTGLIVLGTDANREAIAQLGFDAASAGSAGAHDLVIAVDAADAASAARATERARELLHCGHTAPDGSGHEPRSLRSAIHVCESANLALISVPGEFAAREAATALQAGLHAMVFSDNVSLADEIALKEMAHERGLLMMGPDCGTAVINGVPLGFANVVARGSIGMVGASGTGMQEVMCLIDRFGGGISQAVGIGGRDLSAEVGGIMAIDAVDALAADPATEVVTLVAKPSDASVAARVLERLGATGKPAVAALLGATRLSGPGNGAGCRRPHRRGQAGGGGRQRRYLTRAGIASRAGIAGRARGRRRGMLGRLGSAAPLSARAVRGRNAGSGGARGRGAAGGAGPCAACPTRRESARRSVPLAGAHHHRPGGGPVHARQATSHDRLDRPQRPAAAGGR